MKNHEDRKVNLDLQKIQSTLELVFFQMNGIFTIDPVRLIERKKFDWLILPGNN